METPEWGAWAVQRSAENPCWGKYLHTPATVLLAEPIPFPFGSTAHSCASVILPATQAVAQELSLATIDLYSSFRDQADKFTDADHLTDDAIDLLASSVAAAVSASRPKL